MKYKAVYDVLNERRQTTPGFCYHDRSGWRAYPQTYILLSTSHTEKLRRRQHCNAQIPGLG